MSKGDCLFAAPKYIPREMERLEKDFLRKYTPLQRGTDKDKLSEIISKVHGQFEIIHPFREGNGRVGRLIAELIAIQAGYPSLDYERLGERYIDAMKIFCFNGDLGPLKIVFREAIELGIKEARNLT